MLQGAVRAAGLKWHRQVGAEVAAQARHDPLAQEALAFEDLTDGADELLGAFVLRQEPWAPARSASSIQ